MSGLPVPAGISAVSAAPAPADAIDAGAFGAWLAQARAALRGDGGTEVPCGDCVGCCVSSYYIPLRPQDHEVMARLPAALLVSAPRPASVGWMMGYHADGRCPMLSGNKCTVYAHRPQTCRDYDCRVFTAAGMMAGGEDKAVINRRVAQWRFSYPDEADRRAHAAVRAAAAFIRDRGECFPPGRAPTAPTGIAVMALKTCALFLDAEHPMDDGPQLAAAMLAAASRFDANKPATAPAPSALPQAAR